MTTPSTLCKTAQHNFVPKRTESAIEMRTNDIAEIYCTRCGLVMILKERPKEGGLVRV